jgi:hypothetical protein
MMKPERLMTHDDETLGKSTKIERKCPILETEKNLESERNAPKLLMSCFNCNDI